MILLDRMLGSIAPHYCVGCGLIGNVLCNGCSDQLTLPRRHCYRCEAPNNTFATCLPCREATDLRAVYVTARYEGAAAKLVTGFKFQRVRAAAETMAGRMYRVLPSLPEDVLIVPVPTARQRVRGRGYDQAVLLARAYAARLGRRPHLLLVRYGSQEQVGANRTQRRQQPVNAYEVRKNAPVAGRTILLVDDVVTTGATLEAATATLLRAGAASVQALVFAQA